jgi:hypothetical protein
MVRACSTNWGEEEYIYIYIYIYMILVGKPEEKRPLGRPRRRWVNSIKMDLRYDGVVWTGSIWFRIGTSGGIL